MSERDYDVLWALSTKKQSAYGTALADLSLTKSYPFLGVAVLEEDQGFRSNEDEMGIGEFPTRQDQDVKDCRLTRSFDCGSWLLAWVAALGLGSVTSAVQGATAAYLHTIVPQTATKQLPATTIVESQSAGIKNKVRDMCVSRFKISGKQKERVKLEVDLVGSGHVATSAITMPDLAADSFLHMHSTQFEVGVSGAEVDASARLKAFEIEWNNNPILDDGYYPNSGQVRGRLEHGRRMLTVSFDLLLDANTTERTYLLANTELSAILTMQGALIATTYYHGAVITIPHLKYKALPVGSENNMLLYKVETSVIYNATTAYLVQFEVTNIETAFLDSEA